MSFPQSIDDILNATDSDDDIEHVNPDTEVDLEQLLQDDDDDLFDMPEIPQLELSADCVAEEMKSLVMEDVSPTESDTLHQPLSNGCAEEVLAPTFTQSALESVIQELDTEDFNASAVGVDPLSGLNLAIKREERFLQSGVRDTMSALKSKRTRTSSGSLQSPTRNTHRSSLKLIDMERVSAQLLRNQTYKQHGPGSATCIHVQANFIIIGTTRGLLLVFDHSQELRQVIGSSLSNGSRCGEAVTAIDTNASSSIFQEAFNGLESGSGAGAASGAAMLVVCGYENGEVALWDAAKGALLKRVQDLHFDSVSRIRFISGIGDGKSVGGVLGMTADASVISVDERGSVHRIRFSKILWSAYTYDSDCLLDGTAGPVLDMSVLTPLAFDSVGFVSGIAGEIRSRMGSEPAGRKIPEIDAQLQYVAFNSGSKTYIVQVNPEIKISYRWARPPSVESTPYTALDWSWMMKKKQRSEAHSGPAVTVCRPVLARVWGNVVQVLALQGTEDDSNTADAQNIVFYVIFEYVLAEAQSVWIRWLTPGEKIAVMSTSEVVVLRLVASGKIERVESLRLEGPLQSYLELISPPDLMKPAPAFADMNAAKVYILARDALSAVEMQSWVSRVDELMLDGNWLEALAAALDNYDASPSDGDGDGMSRESDAVTRQESRDTMKNCIRRYVEVAVSKTSISRHSASQTRNHFHLVAGVCIEYCLECGCLELLFEEVFQAFVNVYQEAVFIEALEPYILSRKLSDVPPNILTAQMEWAEQHGKNLALERCWCHINSDDLDKKEYLDYFLRNDMVTVYLYVMSLSSRLWEGFQRVYEKFNSKSADKNMNMAAADLVSKLLLFFKCIAERKVFPRGLQPSDGSDDKTTQRPHPSGAVAELLENLLRAFYTNVRSRSGSGSDSQAQKTAGAEGPTQHARYPSLECLVAVDPAPLFYTLTLMLNTLNADKDGDGYDFSDMITFSNITEMYCELYKFIVLSDADKGAYIHENNFFCMTIDHIKVTNYQLDLQIIQGLLRYCRMQVFPRTVAESLIGTVASRQAKCGLSVESLQCLLENNNFWKARLVLRGDDPIPLSCEQYQHALSAYLHMHMQHGANGCGRHAQTPGRDEEASSSSTGSCDGVVFDFMEEFILYLPSDEPISADYYVVMAQAMADLHAAQPERTEVFCCRHYVSYVGLIIMHTKKFPAVQLALLGAMINSTKAESASELTERFSSTEVMTYIRLLAAIIPTGVYPFITTCDHYPLDECLSVCREKNILDATAFLIERAGDSAGALDLLLEDLSEKISVAKKEIDQQLRADMILFRQMTATESSSSKQQGTRSVASQILVRHGPGRAELVHKLASFTELLRVLECLVGICERNSKDDRAVTWFRAFQFILEQRQYLRAEAPSSTREVMTTLLDLAMQAFIAKMKAAVPPQDIIRCIAGQGEDSLNSGAKLLELKDVMIGMVDSFSADIYSSDLVKKIQAHDLHMLQCASYRRQMRQAERIDPAELLKQTQSAAGAGGGAEPEAEKEVDVGKAATGATRRAAATASATSGSRNAISHRARRRRESRTDRVRHLFKCSAMSSGNGSGSAGVSLGLDTVAPPFYIPLYNDGSDVRAPGTLSYDPSFRSELPYAMP
jgi:hypothetical protein